MALSAASAGPTVSRRKIPDKRCREEAEKLYMALQSSPVEAVLDERDERAGVKFKDADLIGFPYKVIIGPKGLKEDQFELKSRRTGETEFIPIESAAGRISAKIAEEIEAAGSS